MKKERGIRNDDDGWMMRVRHKIKKEWMMIVTKAVIYVVLE